LVNAKLAGAFLAGASLKNVDLSNANFVKVIKEKGKEVLLTAQIQGADMSGAKLTKANLAGQSFDGVIMYNADFRPAILKANYILNGITVEHKIDVGDVIYNKETQFSPEFLPDNLH